MPIMVRGSSLIEQSTRVCSDLPTDSATVGTGARQSTLTSDSRGLLQTADDGFTYVCGPVGTSYTESPEAVPVQGELRVVHVETACFVVVDKPAFLPSENTSTIKDSVRARLEAMSVVMTNSMEQGMGISRSAHDGEGAADEARRSSSDARCEGEGDGGGDGEGVGVGVGVNMSARATAASIVAASDALRKPGPS